MATSATTPASSPDYINVCTSSKYRDPTTSLRPSFPPPRCLSAIGYRLSAIGYRLSAIGYRSPRPLPAPRPPPIWHSQKEKTHPETHTARDTPAPKTVEDTGGSRQGVSNSVDGGDLWIERYSTDALQPLLQLPLT